MMTRALKIPKGYDPKTQGKVGLFAGQLDDQLKRLKAEVANLSVEQLQWQERPGMNTVGMLLAHLALVEVWWIRIAPQEIQWEPEGKAMIQKICNIEDDGLPLSPDGLHPSYLDGFTADRYLAILAKGRRTIAAVMKKWRDRDLDKCYRLGVRQYSQAWTLYHVLEHFAAHFGQILMLKHLMRDAGVLQKAETSGS